MADLWELRVANASVSAIKAAACSNSSAAPAVAYCIAGSARTFATTLVLTHLRLNLVNALSGSSGSRLFLYLKSSDSIKWSGSASAANVHFLNNEAPSSLILDQSLRQDWIATMLGSATIVNGSGAHVDVQDDHGDTSLADLVKPRIVPSDSTAWQSYRLHACSLNETAEQRGAFDVQHSCCNGYVQQGNNEERQIHQQLGVSWCGRAIPRYEQAAGVRFGLLVVTRPDIVWWRPLAPWCAWEWNVKMVSCRTAGCDMAWIAPRNYLKQLTDQHVVHRDCAQLRAPLRLESSCCSTSERLLWHVQRGIPVTSQPNLQKAIRPGWAMNLLRRTYGVCEAALSQVLDPGRNTTLDGQPMHSRKQLQIEEGLHVNFWQVSLLDSTIAVAVSFAKRQRMLSV